MVVRAVLRSRSGVSWRSTLGSATKAAARVWVPIVEPVDGDQLGLDVIGIEGRQGLFDVAVGGPAQHLGLIEHMGRRWQRRQVAHGQGHNRPGSS